jgi:hypothetical protein
MLLGLRARRPKETISEDRKSTPANVRYQIPRMRALDPKRSFGVFLKRSFKVR